MKIKIKKIKDKDFTFDVEGSTTVFNLLFPNKISRKD